MVFDNSLGSAPFRSLREIPPGIIFSPDSCWYIASCILAFPFMTSCKVLGYKGTPRCIPRLGVVRLASTTITSFPISANARPRLAVRNVFPAPPLPEQIQTMRVIVKHYTKEHLNCFKLVVFHFL